MWKKRMIFDIKAEKNKSKRHSSHKHFYKRKQKNIHINDRCYKPIKYVDMWISYLESRFSPTLTISPAPIVINKSPLIQFVNKNFSISSNVGK